MSFFIIIIGFNFEKMVLEINLQKNQTVKLVLKNASREVAILAWTEKNNLSGTLLKNIDSLLKQEKVKFTDLDRLIVESKIENYFTTVRIAHSVANSLNFCLNNRK